VNRLLNIEDGTLFEHVKKNFQMKKYIVSVIFLFIFLSGSSQVSSNKVLEDLENEQTADQEVVSTATLRSASRLFKEKDDLTSVIIVIPKGEIVNIIASDTAFLHVEYQGNVGYIGADHAEIIKSANSTVAYSEQDIIPVKAEAEPVTISAESQRGSRYTYLENKYGTSIAARLYSGKIWKGMNAEMVKDSWGSPRKINSIISGNTVREEWYYGNTMLYFQNSTLTDWGPAK
jgi:hypothetical protein